MNYARCCLLLLAITCSNAAFCVDIGTLIEDCDGCHGPQGVSSDSDMPSIAGQSAKYLIDSMNSYKEWGRPCQKSEYRHGDISKPATTMCKISEALSREDIEALVSYYGDLEFVPAKQGFDSGKAASGAEIHAKQCASCHPKGGSIPARGPILAGQWVPYLKVAIRQSKTGEHLVPPFMERQLADFSDAEIDALMNYYASQQD
jgi:sulfide dehydrogenase cytochrome subunit